MKKLVAFLLISFAILNSKAEEGMLIPTLLGAFESDMQAMGMKLSAEDIYSVNRSSIKDAVIHFAGGCTAEIVSPKALLLTNHHCGFSQIYAHSTVENNRAKFGFWAKNHGEELPNPGLTATRMVRIENVTADVLKGIEGLNGEEINKTIMANIAKIKAQAIKGTHYEAEIKPFDFGNSYYLLVKETFRDIRLVGTPPNSVGKFGGDTDNWVWPRHTGDFSVFRIYADANNLPADYNPNNQPYQPLHFLPVSLKPRNEGDFTMVFGFPGITEQHTISAELDYIIHELRPAQIRMRDLSLSVINAAMRRSDEITINYAPKQARIANAWKKWIGQIDGLKRGNALEKKNDYESNYTETAKGNPEWNKQFGQIVQLLNDEAKSGKRYDFAYNIYVELAYAGADFFKLVRATEDFLEKLEKSGNKKPSAEEIEKLLTSGTNFFEKYSNEIDGDIFKLQAEYYVQIMDQEFLPASMKRDIQALTTAIFTKSIFTDANRFERAVRRMTPKSRKALMKDAAFRLNTELGTVFDEKVKQAYQRINSNKNFLMRTYVKGKYEMFPNHKHWSDANSTLRVTYGKLEGSYPRDGMKYLPYTTIDGIIEKYNTGEADFELLPRFIELYEKKDFGQYLQDGELIVCFTGSNHTTGGNSGSPVIDAEGNLLGLNFDRSWESTMSDYMFDASRCRNITVDMHYVLWMIDIYGGAPHIVEEMTIVR
jgi:hypothetical protein